MFDTDIASTYSAIHKSDDSNAVVQMRADSLKIAWMCDNLGIFAGAKIIGDVTIGDNVSTGANAVVTKDVCSGAVVAGIPARVISMRGKEYSAQYAKGMA